MKTKFLGSAGIDYLISGLGLWAFVLSYIVQPSRGIVGIYQRYWELEAEHPFIFGSVALVGVSSLFLMTKAGKLDLLQWTLAVSPLIAMLGFVFAQSAISGFSLPFSNTGVYAFIIAIAIRQWIRLLEWTK